MTWLIENKMMFLTVKVRKNTFWQCYWTITVQGLIRIMYTVDNSKKILYDTKPIYDSTIYNV